MLRTSPLLEYGPTALVVTAWLGAATATYAATCGLLVMDLKRVIAFSTCSQLGYMMMAVGLSQYSVGLFHLVTHALERMYYNNYVKNCWSLNYVDNSR